MRLQTIGAAPAALLLLTLLPAGAGVSNSTPFHPDHRNAEDYTEMGPHLMIIVPKAMLEGITDDPSSGGPHVMRGDTPYAHIMVPVAPAD